MRTDSCLERACCSCAPPGSPSVSLEAMAPMIPAVDPGSSLTGRRFVAEVGGSVLVDLAVVENDRFCNRTRARASSLPGHLFDSPISDRRLLRNSWSGSPIDLLLAMWSLELTATRLFLNRIAKSGESLVESSFERHARADRRSHAVGSPSQPPLFWELLVGLGGTGLRVGRCGCER